MGVFGAWTKCKTFVSGLDKPNPVDSFKPEAIAVAKRIDQSIERLSQTVGNQQRIRKISN